MVLLQISIACPKTYSMVADASFDKPDSESAVDETTATTTSEQGIRPSAFALNSSVVTLLPTPTEPSALFLVRGAV